MNTYAYVGNNPVNATDPTGLFQDPTGTYTRTAVTNSARVSLGAGTSGVVAAGAAVAAAGAAGYAAGHYLVNPVVQPTLGDLIDEATGLNRRNQWIEDPMADMEHAYYKQECQAKYPTTGDPCQDLRNQAQQAQRCAELRQQWDDKWMPGRHEIEIMKEVRRAENFRRLAEECERNREQCE